MTAFDGGSLNREPLSPSRLQMAKEVMRFLNGTPFAGRANLLVNARQSNEHTIARRAQRSPKTLSWSKELQAWRTSVRHAALL